jgi:hypothetical protein
VAGFDAESYLRLTGERWIREGRRTDGLPCSPVLPAAGAALVAVGAITSAAARAVIDDYHEAQALRQPSRRLPLIAQAAGPAAAAPPRFGQLRVVPCSRVIDQPWGRLTVHYVAFTDRATTARVTVQLSQPQGHPFGGLIPAVRQLPVTDDRGTAATARFGGSIRRGEKAWHGQYRVHPPLAADTAWIELLGERVELTGEPAGIEVRTEPLPAQDPAVRHLWERVATLNDFHDPHLALDAAIAALVAAGALHADDPVIGKAQAALAVLRPGGAGPARDPGAPPEPWRSLLARWRQTGGPVGTIPVGALTPPFDGVTAGVVALDSRDEHFSIQVELVPGVLTGLPYQDLPDQQHLTWWAADDLGNHYLGEQGSWEWAEGWCGGTIGFWPALDTRASSVDLIPTATSTRAVIRVPLRPLS